jgi:hypothetical protein
MLLSMTIIILNGLRTENEAQLLVGLFEREYLFYAALLVFTNMYVALCRGLMARLSVLVELWLEPLGDSKRLILH